VKGFKEKVYIYLILDGDDFIFVYECFLIELDLSFPMSDFECSMLSVMNVSLSQLHIIVHYQAYACSVPQSNMFSSY